jgi:hypothetical protein
MALTEHVAIIYTSAVSNGGSDDLVLISIRLRKGDIDKARIEAERLGMPYQVLIRSWVAEKAATVKKPRTRRKKQRAKRR